MILLSLDVGLTTGYCIQTGVLLDLGVIEYTSADQVKGNLRMLLEEWKPTYCLIEPPVIVRGELGDQLKTVLNAITAMRLPPCEYVQPSQWKGSKAAKGKVPWDGPLTQHERDAYRMGKWWLQNGRSSD